MNIFLRLMLVTIIVSACGIPKEDRKNAEAVLEEIKKVEELLPVREKEYAGLKKAADFKEYAVYAEREKWDEAVKSATGLVGEAKTKYQKNIEPLLKKDEPKDVPQLGLLVLEARRLAARALVAANKPFERKKYIESAKKNYQALSIEAGKELARASAAFSQLSSSTADAKLRFPAKDKEIEARMIPIRALDEKIRNSYKDLVGEKNKAEKNEFADFVLIADNSKFIKDAANKIVEDSNTQTRQVASLSKSHSKTLIDMKVEYFAQVQRFSWDEGAEYPTTHEYKYPPKVISGELYDYFDGLPENLEKIAELTRGFSGDSVKHYIDQGKWNELGIVPRQNWSSGDDTAEYYIELSGKYFHKYSEETNGVLAMTGWIAVSENLFEDHVDDLGMDLFSKPYGTFEDEALKHAAPAGMAFVGNPAYGTWKTDSSGNSFWEFYGKYMFFSHLFGTNRPYYYSRNEWGNWNSKYRGRDAYYGEDGKDKERYGSHGSVVHGSSRYSGESSRIKSTARRHGDTAGTTSGGRGPTRGGGLHGGK